jgi:hypothetical protein
LSAQRIESGRKSRRTTIALAGLCLPASALLAAPLAMAGTPSQDQYTFNLPTPHGQKPAGGHEPVSHPNSLSQSHGRIDLTGNSPSAPAAAVDAAGGGPAVALLAAIAGITVAGAVGFVVPRRRRAR